MKNPCVYLMSSQRNGTLYLGVTSALKTRVWKHKDEAYEGFSKKHYTKTLVWYEVHYNMESAIIREKQIKKWKRAWKLDLIEKMNPQWKDLYDML